MKTLYRRTIPHLLAGSFLWAVTAPAALADYDHHQHGYGWHGDIHHFNDYDFARWRGGHWINAFHGNRNGWWWVIDAQWYFYPTPVYPYPDPFIPPGIALAGPPGQYVYYCPNPAGYYPYVPQCYQPWQAMPQAPQVVAPQPVYAAPVAVSQPTVVVAPRVLVPTQPPSSQRDADDRQLNAFAVELNSIHTSSSHAASRLDDLKKRIEAFHQTLFNRSYNAMDILQDTEKLEKKVSKLRAAVHTSTAPASAPPATPAPTTPLTTTPAPSPQRPTMP